MSGCNQRRNFMDEMCKIIGEIDSLKPEPEVCNLRCPPLGCPRGPCPGMCCYEGLCDPCCISSMPCPPPPAHPPRCCAPPCIREYAASVGVCLPECNKCTGSQGTSHNSSRGSSHGSNHGSFRKPSCCSPLRDCPPISSQPFCPSPCGPPPMSVTPVCPQACLLKLQTMC